MLNAPQCPYCKDRFFGEVVFCEHVAFVYSEWGISEETGATDEQIAWLDGGESRRKFDSLCRTFKLKKLDWVEEGMACGPVRTCVTLAFDGNTSSNNGVD